MLNASKISKEEGTRKMVNMMKFGMAEELSCKRALKRWEVFQTVLGDPRADMSFLLNLRSDLARKSC